MTMSKSMRSTAPDIIHVAVAIVVNSVGEILISRRPKGVHLEGHWEFPGGKVERGESVFEALQREIQEETNLQIHTARRLINITHEYPEKTVRLDTWLCEHWTGEAHGLEGQEIRWVAVNELSNFNFPAADIPIISALHLPPIYQISPEPGDNIDNFLDDIEVCFRQSVRLFQLRAKSLNLNKLQSLAAPIRSLCDEFQAKWLINGDAEMAESLQSDGVHLDSKRLHQLKSRPLGSEFIVAASCHNAEDLIQAEHINVDFAVLSPVKKTRSHPEAVPIGLDGFERLIENSNIPIYGLGGMSTDDLESIWKLGGQGVAMIRAGWPNS